MATVQQIYDACCFDLLEDGGLVLGLLSIAQFIDLLNLTVIDLNTQTAVSKGVYTQQIISGVSRYTVPDSILRVDSVFCSGRLVPPTTVSELNAVMRGWRRAPTGNPKLWHEDEVPIRTLELVPAPNYTGAVIGGGFASSFWVAGQSPAQHMNLSLVGPLKPPTVFGITDGGGNPIDIPLIPNDAAVGYLGFGVLERVFSSDNDLKDPQRALYCGAQYREGISALKAVMSEVEVEEG